MGRGTTSTDTTGTRTHTHTYTHTHTHTYTYTHTHSPESWVLTPPVPGRRCRGQTWRYLGAFQTSANTPAPRRLQRCLCSSTSQRSALPVCLCVCVPSSVWTLIDDALTPLPLPSDAPITVKVLIRCKQEVGTRLRGGERMKRLTSGYNMRGTP